jgi:hypothetical protein
VGQNPPDNASEDPREDGLYGKQRIEANAELGASLSRWERVRVRA